VAYTKEQHARATEEEHQVEVVARLRDDARVLRWLARRADGYADAIVRHGLAASGPRRAADDMRPREPTSA